MKSWQATLQQENSLPAECLNTVVALVETTDEWQGVHFTKAELFSISLSEIGCLQDLAPQSTHADYSSAEWVIGIVMDVAQCRSFGIIQRKSM